MFSGYSERRWISNNSSVDYGAPYPTKTRSSGAARPIEAHNLYVSNLSFATTEASLESHVSQCGEVVHVCILAKLSGQGARRAFVDLVDPAAAQRVVQHLHRSILDGRQIDVSYAIVQRRAGYQPPRPFCNADRSNTRQAVPRSGLDRHFDSEPSSSSATIIVSNLPSQVDLSQLLDSYHILCSQRSKDCGVVILSSSMEADRARREFDGFWIGNRQIGVENWSLMQNEQQSPTQQISTFPPSANSDATVSSSPPPHELRRYQQQQQQLSSPQSHASNDSLPQTPTDSLHRQAIIKFDRSVDSSPSRPPLGSVTFSRGARDAYRPGFAFDPFGDS